MFYTQYATCSCKYLISYYVLLTTLEIFIYFLVLHLFIVFINYDFISWKHVAFFYRS